MTPTLISILISLEFDKHTNVQYRKCFIKKGGGEEERGICEKEQTNKKQILKKEIRKRCSKDMTFKLRLDVNKQTNKPTET